MPERKKEVKTYKIEYVCDECGEGDMRPTGICLTSNPPQYPHTCTVCGHEKRFRDKKYPLTVYEES